MLVQRNFKEAEKHRSEAAKIAETNPDLMSKIQALNVDKGTFLELYELATGKNNGFS